MRELVQHHLPGAEGGVVAGGAGEDDDLDAAVGGAVEHALEGFDALRVAVGEGVVEDDGEAAVVVGGEELGLVARTPKTGEFEKLV